MSRTPLFYYITDRSQFPGDESARRRQLLVKVAEAARCGVDYIQLREKDLSARQLQELAQEVMDLIEAETRSSARKNTRMLVNSRTDIALATKAGGVHLRSEDVSPGEVRKIAQSVLARRGTPGDFLIGTSCHSEEQVAEAAGQGADFVVFAPVFEKRGTTPTSAAGVDRLRRACRQNIPVFALGGVTLDNARLCLQAGAAGIAGIRLFQQKPVAEMVQKLRPD
jgi:thiamine-phosphate pyrophosphorylase